MSLQQPSNEARSILPRAPRLVRPGLVSDGRVAQQVLRELRGGKVPPARALLHCLEVVSRCSEPRGVVAAPLAAVPRRTEFGSNPTWREQALRQQRLLFRLPLATQP
jgi:hypothetical protein